MFQFSSTLLWKTIEINSISLVSSPADLFIIHVVFILKRGGMASVKRVIPLVYNKHTRTKVERKKPLASIDRNGNKSEDFYFNSKAKNLYG
jgi:cbb3-type cytochrome oxidase cytochrome c subunit